jgi:hypothetical protein
MPRKARPKSVLQDQDVQQASEVYNQEMQLDAENVNTSMSSGREPMPNQALAKKNSNELLKEKAENGDPEAMRKRAKILERKANAERERRASMRLRAKNGDIEAIEEYSAYLQGGRERVRKAAAKRNGYQYEPQQPPLEPFNALPSVSDILQQSQSQEGPEEYEHAQLDRFRHHYMAENPLEGKRIRDMSYEELARLQHSLAGIPKWRVE